MNITWIKSFLRKKPEEVIEDTSFNNISKLAGFSKSASIYKTSLDDYSYIAVNSIVHNSSIGKFCSIGPNVVIGYGEHPVNFISTSPVFYQSTTGFDLKPTDDKFFGHQRVSVGSDVWIGANCFLRNGITVGHGAIIGAGAVITKDIPPYAVVTGVPGKIRKFRFDDKVIEQLLSIGWWDWDLQKIKAYHTEFGTSDVLNFIYKHFDD
jgi:acetyltransferase-like isoleucine patch superfamily enzyme